MAQAHNVVSLSGGSEGHKGRRFDHATVSALDARFATEEVE